MNTIDFIVLAFILLVPILIGLYFGYKKQIRKFFKLNNAQEHSTLSEYLVASSDMSAIPIAFSLLAIFVSTNTFLGYIYKIDLYINFYINVK